MVFSIVAPIPDPIGVVILAQGAALGTESDDLAYFPSNHDGSSHHSPTVTELY